MRTRPFIPFLIAIAAAFTAAGTAQGQTTDTVPLPPGTDSVPILEIPRAINLEDFKRAQRRNYPRLLYNAGVGGVVQTSFRVLQDGSVDRDSIIIDSSSHEQLKEPTIRSVSVLRFQPARIATGPVSVWVTLPVVWAVGP